MIGYDGMQEFLNCKKLKDFGISQECFFSLPYEYQKAIIMAGTEAIAKEKKRDEIRKKMALQQYNFEEKVKEKVLTLFKKK